ncbi:FecR domain-containing protein [Paraflavisolibacter sp. H34]|uniref:FecR domain-containing protein n=1 Tax=Huijunlia imazamoxiresistens TaxID=3127457 RepID=UPI00301A2AED
MENNPQYDELLVRYLFKEATGEEQVRVENWLHASEENRRYFERLEKAWQLAQARKDLDYLLTGVDLEDRWNRFEQRVAAKEETPAIPLPEHQPMAAENPEEEKPRKSGVYRVLVAAAIAASVLLVIGLGWTFFAGRKPEAPIARDAGKRIDSVAYVTRHEVNTEGRDKRIRLADGSLVVLGARSEITYREPFGNQRELLLAGKAFFQVAKDRARPFTVRSGEIATTALGTEFTVSAYKGSGRVVVRLFEGKVVVRAAHKANKRMPQDVYLSPGQEFVYGGPTARVHAFRVNSNAAHRQLMTEEPSESPSLPQQTKGTWFQFNNRPVNEILDQLAEIYKVKIIYHPKEVQDLYFIGKYNSSDSVEMILNRIGFLNNLTITRNDSAFVISRQ